MTTKAEQARQQALVRLEEYGACIGPSDDKHLHVELSSIDDDELAEAVADVNAVGNVSTLDLSESTISDATAGHLANLKDVTQLYLCATEITDAAIPDILRIRQLEGLVLSGTAVTDKGVAQLSALANLSFLQLLETAVTEGQVNALQSAVTRLSVEWSPTPRPAEHEPVSKEELKQLRKAAAEITLEDGLVVRIELRKRKSREAVPLLPGFPHVKELQMHSLALQGKEYEPIAELRNLERVSICGCGGFGNQGPTFLSGLEQLRQVYISFLQETAVPLEPIGQLTQLTDLTLVYFHLAHRSVSALSSLGELVRLDLSCSTGIAHALTAARPLSALRELCLHRSDATDEDLTVLTNFEHLEILNISDNLSITGDSATHIQGLQTLRELWLWGTNFDDSGMPALAKLTSLRRLDLRKCPISDAALEHIRPLKQLTKLTLSGTAVTESAVERLRDSNPALIVQS